MLNRVTASAGETILQTNYWSRDELAQQLDTTVRHADRMRAAGVGPPCIRIAGKIFYPKNGVLKWLAAQESPSNFRGRRSDKAKKALQEVATS